MRRYSSARLLFLGLLALAMELTLAPRVTFLGGRAEPLLVLACFAALFANDTKQGYWTAWLLGLAKDLGTASPLGLYALLFLAAAFGIMTIRKVLFREHPLIQFVAVLLIALIINIVVASYVVIFTGALPFWTIVRKCLAGSLLTAALAPVAILFLLGWKSFLRPHG